MSHHQDSDCISILVKRNANNCCIQVPVNNIPVHVPPGVVYLPNIGGDALEVILMCTPAYKNVLEHKQKQKNKRINARTRNRH